MPNAIVFALLGLLHEKGLLGIPLSAWPWRAHLRRKGIYSECWLPFYEAIRRKWTTDRKLIAAVTSDPVLSKMLAEKVTFLEDQIFDAKKLDVSRRVFSKIPAVASTPRTKPKVRNFGDIVVSPSDFEY